MRLDELPPTFLRGLALVFGLLWGSFLNVVIYRVPRELSVVSPPSACPACGKNIAPYDNIPVLSFLVLRGKARCCGAPMSPRYVIVEILGGLLSLAVLEGIVLRMPGGVPFWHASLVYLADLALCLGLLAAAFIDAEHMFLPDAITLGGTVLGLVSAPLRGLGLVESLVGGLIGFLGVWLPFGILYRVLRGRAGMGLGDAKLVMLAGTWFGLAGAMFTLFGGAIQGSLGAIALFLLRGKIEEPASVKAEREELQRMADEGDEEAKQILADDPLGTEPEEGIRYARIPFGPFLIFACLEFLFAGDFIVARVGSWLLPE